MAKKKKSSVLSKLPVEPKLKSTNHASDTEPVASVVDDQ